MKKRKGAARVGVLPLFLCVCAIFGASARGAVAQGAEATDLERAAAAEKLLRATFRAGEPGASALVARNGRVIFRGNYGIANRQTKEPITSDTVFDTGSVSKAFTAAAVLLLAEEGKLATSDLATKYLPELAGYKRAITLHHLLTHTSGLPSFEPEEERTQRQFSPEDVVRWHAREKRLRFAPGERYEYSNSGYVLLGVLVARVSGKTFAEFVQERIFAPLGMTRTTLARATKEIAGRATGYRVSGESGFLVVSDSDGLRVQGDGGIQSTAENLLRWAESWYSGKLLRADSIRAAWTSAQLNDGKRIAYGYGWGFGRVEGRTMVSHDGRARGFRAYLAMFPGDGNVTIIVLANQREHEAGDVAMKLAKVFLGGAGL